MLPMFISIVKWAIKVPTLLFLDLFTVLFSPILCLFVTHAEESDVTGFPSMFPGKPREFLIKPLMMFQTFDAPLDEWWYGDYYPNGKLKTKYTQADYDSKWWLRYVCRIFWLCRNSAYGFGLALGYDSNDMVYAYKRDESAKWKLETNSSYFVAVNPKGQVGWWYQAQWFYTSTRCVMINIGYKLDSDSPNGNKLVAMQFNPFRTYK